MYVYINIDTKCDIDCIDGDSCSMMYYHIETDWNTNLDLSCSNNVDCFTAAQVVCDEYSSSSELIYDTYYDTFSCSWRCCPDPFNLVEIECDSSENCIIDCVEQICVGQLINAAYKSSLTVTCDENNIYSSCNSLLIFCPFNGECNFQCSLNDECEEVYIYKPSNDYTICLYPI